MGTLARGVSQVCTPDVFMSGHSVGSSAGAKAYYEQQRANGKPRNTVVRALVFKRVAHSVGPYLRGTWCDLAVLFYTALKRFRDEQGLGPRKKKFRFKNKLLSLDSRVILLFLRRSYAYSYLRGAF